MAKNDRHDDARPSRIGYAAAIFFSAIGHVALFAVVFIVLPRYLHSEETPPPSYTVKIVDSLPAGDLGSHLPRLAPRETRQEAKAEEHKAEEPKIKVEAPKPIAPENDKNAIALNNVASVTPTPTPTPTPEPTVEPTVEPTPEPTEKPTPKPKPSHTKHATPKPTPATSKNHNKPKAESTVVIAKADSKAAIAAKLAVIRQNLMKEHVQLLEKRNAEDADSGDDDDSDTTSTTGPSGGGPVAANSATAGKGYGIGPGTGSMGIQQDPEFLLYYQSVQDKIKKSWTFLGGSNDLTATVDFSIGPDGTLTSAKIGNSSKDGSFDDSVLRAIKHAAPFPPPPAKYRNQFSGGIEAVFNLGELKS